eukprot:9063956-Pyramimonas_sp.AAC.1
MDLPPREAIDLQRRRARGICEEARERGDQRRDSHQRIDEFSGHALIHAIQQMNDAWTENSSM